MMQEKIIALLKREMDTIEHNINGGSCPDFVTYREQVSMLKAFRAASDIVKKALAEDGDEDDQ
jgi:hypothetical protein